MSAPLPAAPPCPAKYQGCEFEWKAGWESAPVRGRYNPVRHRGVDGELRRDAWYAGRRAGLKALDRLRKVTA